MEAAWAEIKAMLENGFGDNRYLLLFVLALVYLWFAEKKWRWKLVVPSAVLTVLILNPFLYVHLWKPFFGYAYWRMFWMIPIIPVLAAAVVSLLCRIRNRIWKTAAAAVMAIVLIFSGAYIYTGENTQFVQAENAFKLPEDAVQTAAFLLSREEEPRAVIDTPLCYYVRQYSSAIHMMYGRNMEGGYIIAPDDLDREMYSLVKSQEPDLARMREIMQQENYTYLVINLAGKTLPAYSYAAAGFRQIGTAGAYTIFQLDVPQPAAEGWTVTQYGSDSQQQFMFYTITDAEGHLVLIDGGHDNAEESRAVRDVIRQNGNHVDAWIITHPHPDHVGAFNAVMRQNAEAAEEDRITVDRIYTVPVNQQRYAETAADYDGIQSYYDFLSLTADMDNVTFLRENDVVDLCGLRMTVLHSWDAHVDALPDHLCNDGSLMFRLDGAEDSMLFCSDVQKEMEQFIVPAHEQQLDVDFVQLGHHGNWGLSQEFYDKTSPRAVFFDAPASILDNADPEMGYDGHILRDHFSEMGCAVYRFSTAPNRIVLK